MVGLPHFFGFVPARRRLCSLRRVQGGKQQATRPVLADIEIGELMSDLPTPCLLLELSLAENYLGDMDLDVALSDIEANNVSLDGSVFVHTKVTSTAERDEITSEQGSGKSPVICDVDVPVGWVPEGAFLGIGLANHHVGGYYWARGMGIGASLPAHGVCFGVYGESQVGKQFWKKRGPGENAMETTEESSNSNDGKRSEWADFLAVGDQVQLIPNNARAVLLDSEFCTILGIRRIGRPLGADPVVERIWRKSSIEKSEKICWKSQ